MRYLLNSLKQKMSNLKINADRFIGQIDLPVIIFFAERKQMQELRDYNIKNKVDPMIHSLQISELRRKLKEL